MFVVLCTLLLLLCVLLLRCHFHVQSVVEELVLGAVTTGGLGRASTPG